MKLVAFLGALCAAVLTMSVDATASVVARINLSKQTMHVSVNGVPSYTWPISAGRRGYRTPVGSYRPTRMHRMWYSRKYDMTPMPHSIFFRGGYAIHGTSETRRLGRPASHGCIRLHPSNAAALYSLVKRHGRGNTRILISW